MSAEPARLLPHRPPLLLLDRVERLEPGRAVAASKAIRSGEPWLLPDGYPPLLLLESWMQAAAVVLGAGDAPVVVGGLRDVSFGRPARAGELVEHHVEVLAQVDGSVVCTGGSACGGTELLAVGQVTLSAGTGG